MEACLGIYLGERIIKYAKLIRDEKSRRISLNSCGTKYIVGNKESAIAEIIEQTGSKEDKLVVNLSGYNRITTEVLKQLGKIDTGSVIDLEVEDYATSHGVNEKTLEYRYFLTDSTISDDSYAAHVTVIDKSTLNSYEKNPNFANLVGLYPQEFILDKMVEGDSSYLIVNVDEETKLISVVKGKANQVIDLDVNMKTILDSLAEQEGSYSKACELCKSINVLSDESISFEIEQIIEPVIQDLLNRIKTKIEELKVPYQKIYLNGLINLFINIELLFEEFFGITTEKLRPHFIKMENIPNMAEAIESSDAIALAYQGIEPTMQDINFTDDNTQKGNFLSNIFTKKGEESKSKDGSKAFVMPNINLEKIEKALLFANLTAGVTLAGYVGFTAIYDSQMTKYENELTSKTNGFKAETAQIKDDINYINGVTKQYTTFNNYIQDAVTKIKEGKIGKYTTYNVANFMQKIARYIPTNVQLETISSDDNKEVTIIAKSSSYVELGYFISQLKLQGVLNKITTRNVVNGSNQITVTIGGELP